MYIVIYLGTQLEHPRDRYRKKTKNKLKKEAEDKVACLGTPPWHPRDRVRDRVKDDKKNGTNNNKGKKIYINGS